jgi:hypothetical protein
MIGAMPDRPTKITFGEMRDMGVRGILVYCADYRCSLSIATRHRRRSRTSSPTLEQESLCQAAQGIRGAINQIIGAQSQDNVTPNLIQ